MLDWEDYLSKFAEVRFIPMTLSLKSFLSLSSNVPSSCPFSFFLVPCSLFPVRCSLFVDRCSLFPLPCFLIPIPNAPPHASKPITLLRTKQKKTRKSKSKSKNQYETVFQIAPLSFLGTAGVWGPSSGGVAVSSRFRGGRTHISSNSFGSIVSRLTASFWASCGSNPGCSAVTDETCSKANSSGVLWTKNS